MIICHDDDIAGPINGQNCTVMCCIFLHISVWYTLVLKEAKERHAIKEVKDAIIKGKILETVHLLHFASSQNLFYIS